ncbi:hypothetical protein GYMLUDRAFT_1022449 [Collybiopsis luxurians FD-317 M1]|uniref:Nucleolar pre-ribosomal-associated protein 1 n=1 Tax=Collybiopsis luxurians FD-317 M1 TaxID=944289 RepID=A0A0D0AVC0_9AGAR|nr:hypothetical protein GYMLUDRAFT_1022449 [Collybiopsis luxurians FD-317 M1]
MPAAGPSQGKGFKVDGSKPSGDANFAFKLPADIDKALKPQENADSVIRVLSAIQWQFQNPGTHQNTLKLWLQSTSAEALLTLWDNLESEGAYGKVLSLLLSLLGSILRFLSSSPDRDNRLSRSLLSTIRVGKLNTYLSGKNFNKNASTTQNAGLVAETLNLLTVLVDWDAKTVLESVRWDMEALPRILRTPRKDGKGKGKEKMRLSAHADSPPRASLLSLVTAMLGQNVPARVKSAFLAPGTPTLSLLQNLLSGLGDSYNDDEYLYSYSQIKSLLEALYAGVWCDKRVTRTAKVVMFAFGHGPSTAMKTDVSWSGKKAGQAGGEKVWKGLLALYSRTDLESSPPRGVQNGPTHDRDEDGVPADLVHHFLLALCTRPGQGICFRDQGWYPPNQSDTYNDEHSHVNLEDQPQSNSLRPHLFSSADEDVQVQNNSSKHSIHNPLLLRVLRLLSPSADPRQQELAARILEACPELVASCGDVISGGPGALDPRLNARWMAGITWYGRVVALPVPEETFYLFTSGGGGSDSATGSTPRVAPPQLRSVVESILPSFSGGGTKTVLTKTLVGSTTSAQETGGSIAGLGLVQHTMALMLCRCFGKYMQVRSAFLKAAQAAGEFEEIAVVGTRVKSSPGAWSKRLAEVNKEIRSRLPDAQVILAFLKRVEAAASSQRDTSSTASKASNPTALALLSESAYRLVWLYHACFATNSLSTADEGPGRFDVGSLVASLSMVSVQSDNLAEEEEVDTIIGLKTMKDIHILRTLRLNGEFGSRVFNKAGKQTHFHLLLRALARGPVLRGTKKAGHVVLQGEIRRLLQQVLSSSVLFRRNEGVNDRYSSGFEEVQLWLAALAGNRDLEDADTVVAFLDDCVQRCMRTPERYLDALGEVFDATMSRVAQPSEADVQDGLPSPLLMTLVEQLDNRIRAVYTEEQQQPHTSAEPSSYTSSLRSLLAILAFTRNLFVRLAALCETRALPVLWALIRKMTSGKSFQDVHQGSRTLESVRTEASELLKVLKFSHGDAGETRPVVAESREQGFEMLYALSTLKDLANPEWRSTVVEKAFAENPDDSAHSLLANILRATRLISHSLAAATDSIQIDQLDAAHSIESLLSLCAQFMHKLAECSLFSAAERRLVREYVFHGNDVLRGFWMRPVGPTVCKAIETLLQSSALSAEDPADHSILAEIPEYWVAQLQLKLEGSQSTSAFTPALLWLRYTDPQALCGLLDLAYTCCLHSELRTTAVDVISTCIEALRSHARAADAGESGAEFLSVATQLMRLLPIFLSLSSERAVNPALQPIDPEALEELVLYALNSHLPVGHDGRLSASLCESPVSLHHQRRHRWQQRLNIIQNIPHSDVFVQHYLARDDTETWSTATVDVVCNAIYSRYIELDALYSWLSRLNKAYVNSEPHIFEKLAPILYAHLDCVHARGGLSGTDEEAFWKAYEIPLSSLIKLAFRTVPSLSTEIQAACGTSIGILLELVDGTPSAQGQKLMAILIEHIKTLSLDGMSMELLMVGRKGIGRLTKELVEVGEAVVDHALQWVVRMLTGCREIEDKNTKLLSELVKLLSAVSSVKPHLAEPVLTAVVREHPQSEITLQLLEVVLPKAHLKPLIVNRHLQILVQHPHFSRVTTPSTKRALASVLYTLFHLHPTNTCQPSHVQPLIRLYGGSASVADRKLLAIFHLFEEHRRTSMASLLARWSPLPEGFQSTSALEALRDVDSLLVLRTALHFPQWRLFGNTDASNHWEQWPEGPDIYDPVFLLLLFSHVAAEEVPKTAQGWVEIFRTNIVGLLIRALSAKDGSLRELAATQIAVLWKCLENTDMIEKPHVLHILSLLRDALRPAQGSTPERLPSYTTLLLAHALRGVFYPSHFVYPITARFLLQRPTLDIGDVPMLYGMLYSSAEDYGRKERAWIIRMLADGMQSSADWGVFKRRHTWDLLASVFQSEEKERTLRRGILEVLANLTCVPQAVMSLLLKSSLLTWIEMQLLMPHEDEGLAWLKVLENLIVVTDNAKMELSTGGEWRASIVRCLILLIDGCRSLRTFPVFNLLSGIVLRLALLPGRALVQMPTLLSRCVDMIKEREIPVSITTLPVDFEPLFKAPHGAFRLHEVPQLSSTVLCASHGESIEQLWRVAMMVDEEKKLPAWDELTSILLIWRAWIGERSVEGEWVRKQVIRSISSPVT